MVHGSIFFNYDDPSGFMATGNFCIKGLAITNPYVSIDESDHFGSFALQQNTPNPFNEKTTIKYILPGENKVSLRIYDITGKEIATW